MPFHHLTNQQLQCCHYWHLHKVPYTRIVEKVGRSLMAPGPPKTHRDLLDFSKQVCRWGGKTGPRVYGRIKKNFAPTILSGFNSAIARLRLGHPNLLLDAKRDLGLITGLGSFSYSSKHLRMLAPELSPVLDSLVDGFLVTHSARYAKSSIDDRFLGYADFCQVKARELTSRKVKLGDFLMPANLGSLITTANEDECRWTAADIDMACFAWIKGWCSAGGKSSDQNLSRQSMPSPAKASPSNLDKVLARGLDQKSKRPIFLAQNHVRDTAVTIKEECGRRWNNAWICRSHGSLDFKNEGALGTTRYLIGELLILGEDVTQHPNWEPSPDGSTCHHAGSDFQGRLCMESVEDAVRYLKQFFNVLACGYNRTETQTWINAL